MIWFAIVPAWLFVGLVVFGLFLRTVAWAYGERVSAAPRSEMGFAGVIAILAAMIWPLWAAIIASIWAWFGLVWLLYAVTRFVEIVAGVKR